MTIVSYETQCDLCGANESFKAPAGSYNPLPEGWVRVDISGMAGLDVCPKCRGRTLAEAAVAAGAVRSKAIEAEKVEEAKQITG